MTIEACFIGVEFYWNIFLVVYIRPSIMSILPHSFRDEKLSTEKCGNSKDHKGDNQLDEVGVVSGFRLLVHVILLKFVLIGV